MPKRYFTNFEEVKRAAEKNGIEIVPALFGMGYSNDLLNRNPNLAEGLPVKDALFVVSNGEANIVADPPVGFPGGDMYNRKKWGIVDDELISEGGVLHATFSGEPEMKALAEGQRFLSYTKLKARAMPGARA